MHVFIFNIFLLIYRVSQIWQYKFFFQRFFKFLSYNFTLWLSKVEGADRCEITLISLYCYDKQSNVDIMIRLWSPIDAFKNFASLERQ